MRLIIHIKDEPITLQNPVTIPAQSLLPVDPTMMDFDMTDSSMQFHCPMPTPIETPIETSESFKEETSSQPSSPPQTSSQTSSKSSQKSEQIVLSKMNLSKTNFMEEFCVKTENEKGQWIVNQNIYKFPIDFIFKEEDAQGRLKVCVLDNKGPEARRYNKHTPFIFYAIDKIFSRDDYEQKRKTMLTRNKFFKCSQTEFRVRLTRFPQCFLLVELSKSRKEWFWQHFKDHPRILEFIQIKPLPSDDKSIEEQSFTYETEDDWFRIDDTDDFYPETGMFQLDDTEKGSSDYEQNL